MKGDDVPRAATAEAQTLPHQETAISAVRTVRDASHDVLRQLNTTTVFGNPGSHELPFLADWPQDFRFVLALHEGVAMAAADGYAQYADTAAVVLLHAAAGLGHSVGQLVNASRSRSPLILLVGRQHRSLLTGEPFVDLYGLRIEGLVKRSYHPQRPGDVPVLLAQAHHTAMLPPRGPVMVTVPADDWAAAASPHPVKPAPEGFTADIRTLAQITAALTQARRPAFVVSGDVDRDGAVPKLVELADAARADVWHAPLSSRSGFIQTHPRFRGHLPAEPAKAANALKDEGYDVVVAFGTVDTWHTPPPGGVMPVMPYTWVISEDTDVLARTPGVSVPSGVGAAIRALAAMFALRPPRAARRLPPPRPAAGRPSAAGRVYQAIGAAMPEAILVEEAPAGRREMHAHYQVDTPGGYYTPAAGTLGGGLAGAVGVALARPDRQVVAVVGDGAALYTVQALWTAARVGLRLVVVVLDNGGYQVMRDVAAAIGASGVPGLDIAGVDWPRLAGGFGVPASSVDSRDVEALRGALRDAAASSGPSLLRVPVA